MYRHVLLNQTKSLPSHYDMSDRIMIRFGLHIVFLIFIANYSLLIIVVAYNNFAGTTNLLVYKYGTILDN